MKLAVYASGTNTFARNISVFITKDEIAALGWTTPYGNAFSIGVENKTLQMVPDEKGRLKFRGRDKEFARFTGYISSFEEGLEPPPLTGVIYIRPEIDPSGGIRVPIPYRSAEVQPAPPQVETPPQVDEDEQARQLAEHYPHAQKQAQPTITTELIEEYPEKELTVDDLRQAIKEVKRIAVALDAAVEIDNGQFFITLKV
jgi:hypothetical protein